jgi:hypothetical protein
MGKNKKNPSDGGGWIGVGVAIGAAAFVATKDPLWIPLGVVVGAALSWRTLRDQKQHRN